MPNRLPAATGLPGAAGVLRGASTPHPRPKSPSRCFRRRQMETQPPKPSAPGPRRGGGKRRAGQVPPGAEQGLPGPGEGDRRHVSTSGAARLRGAHAQSAPISAGGGGGISQRALCLPGRGGVSCPRCLATAGRGFGGSRPRPGPS